MYIKKLVLNNFRCFSHTEIELNYPGRAAARKRPIPKRMANVNLLLGGNGSGKSSVLKALVLGVLSPVINSSGYKADYLVRRKPGQPPQSTVKGAELLKESGSVNAYLKLDKRDVDAPGKVGGSIIGQTIIERTGDFEKIVSTAHNNPDAWKNIYLDNSPAFFLAGYGAYRRTERPEGYSQQSRSSRYQRVASLFEEHVGLVPFNFGYLQLKDWGCLKQAQAILNALLPAGVNLTDSAEGQQPLFSQEGVLLPFSALSDGFRAFVGWVWDLLFQIASLQQSDAVHDFGDVIYDFRNAVHDLKSMVGVVIVDEIDLFLHPEWQRIVIEQVAQMFPYIQFLFSSHSPIVAGTLEPENIFVLEGEKVEQYRENVYGLTPNQVLTSSYFGLRSLRAPNTGTMSDLANRMRNGAGVVGIVDATSVPEQAEPDDRGLNSQERALQMLEELRST